MPERTEGLSAAWREGAFALTTFNGEIAHRRPRRGVRRQAVRTLLEASMLQKPVRPSAN